MKQRRRQVYGLTRERIPGTETGRSVQPADESKENVSGGKPLVCSMGYRHGHPFLAAAAYLGLKVGQVFEAAIPSPS